MQRTDGRNEAAVYWAATGFGMQGLKLLLQEGCPLPDGGLPHLASLLREHPSLSNVSVSTHIHCLHVVQGMWACLCQVPVTTRKCRMHGC
jgi:hypothetical protein